MSLAIPQRHIGDDEIEPVHVVSSNLIAEEVLPHALSCLRAGVHELRVGFSSAN